ncbi:hypothetical protein EDB89DRAFT_2245626 [Lactarius sanguifluus]|nr:hypothetical protein EDB89DRAFT_2245626 [Lactarius sanguifluus]
MREPRRSRDSENLVASQTKEKNALKVEVRTLKEALRLFAKDYHSNKHASGRGFSSTTSEKGLTVESEPTTSSPCAERNRRRHKAGASQNFPETSRCP